MFRIQVVYKINEMAILCPEHIFKALRYFRELNSANIHAV
jgi:hypothetical protein